MAENKESGRRLRVRERRRYTEEYADEEILFDGRAFDVEEKLVSDRFNLNSDLILEMNGEELTLNYLQENGFERPIIIKKMSGLGIKIPPKTFSIWDVKACVGSRRVLDVMDVETQRDFHMTMKEWCNYYHAEERDRLLNVISLEFSHTKLETFVDSPTIVKKVDWVDWVWPKHLKESQTEGTNAIDDMKYPKVQKYCLMSVKGCYTDFHIDFGGTSVWYHILKGKKVFWLIPPSERNIQLYEQWVLSGKQSDIFFGDTVEQCGRVYLEEGYTFFIPTGWIHAVYTPEDSLVFGGNFLHSFGIEKQLRVAQVEDITKVPSKFRYPFYTEVLWYVLARYVYCLMGKNHLNCNDDGTPMNIPHESADEKPLILNGKLTNGSSASDNTVNSLSKPHQHLTSCELNGLKAIIMWLSRLPPTKRSLPDLVTNAEALLNDAKVLIDEHARDNHKIAITGKPVLFWTQKSKSLQTPPPSITSQLRQIKHHQNNHNKIKNLINNGAKDSHDGSSGSSSVSNGSVARPESPPTRPLSSNQYRISVGTTLTADIIPSSFAGLIAATGVGNSNGGYAPSPSTPSITPIITSSPSIYIPSSPAHTLPPPPPLISVAPNNGPHFIIPNATLSLIKNNNNQTSVTKILNNDDTKFQSNVNQSQNFQIQENPQTNAPITSVENQNRNCPLKVTPHEVASNTSSSITNTCSTNPYQAFASAFTANTSTMTNYQEIKSFSPHGQPQTHYLPTAVPPSGFHPPERSCPDNIKMVNSSTTTALGLKTSTGTSTSSKSVTNDSSRRRRTRCKKCDSCLRADCGECHFCKDMKKFGGPGRMKQSCIARQCMAPVLPHTACCMICGRDGWEKLMISEHQTLGDDTASSLMECSQCWEIVHPFCLGEKYASLPHSGGSINNDLPNSWECPRCVRSGKSSGTASSSGSNSKIKNGKLSSCPNWSLSLSTISTSTSTSPLMMIKTEDNYSPQPNKRLKLDDESPPSTEDEDEGANDEEKDNDDTEDDENSVKKAVLNPSAHVRSCARFPLLSQGFAKASLSPQSSSPLSLGTVKKNGSSVKSEVKGLAAIAMSNKKKNETSRDRLFKSLKGLKKSSELMSVSRSGLSSQMMTVKKAAAKLQKESSSGSSSSVGSPSYVQPSNSSAMSSAVTINASSINHEYDRKKYVKQEDDDESTEDEDHDQINHEMINKDDDNKKNGNENMMVSHQSKDLKKPKFVVRPAPLEEDISSTEIEDSSATDNDNSDTDEDEDNDRKMKKERQKAKKRHLKKFLKKRSQTNLALERDAVLPILPFLHRDDLIRCMSVCRVWNRWCCDPSLWPRLDLTRKKITSSALIGIVRRQPQELNLSWTNISKRQIVWLIARVPQLMSLSLAGCSSVTIGALSSCNCPLLKHLDLSWSDGINDDLIRDLLSAPLDSRPGVMETKTRLRFLTKISIAGSDISDVSIRLMTHHLPNLSSIDLSHCHKVTDMGIAVLGAAKASKLVSLNLSSCSNISDTSLDALRRCSSLMMLDTRECPQVTVAACNKFIACASFGNTSGHKLIMKQPKLIEMMI